MDFSAIVKDMRDLRDSKEIEEYGKILSDAEREEKEKELERANKEEEIKRSMNLFLDTVPRRFKNATFDTFICSSKKQESVIEFLKKGKSAIIYGSNGTGKTHLAFASCFYQVAQGMAAKYVLAFDFFNEVRKSFGDYSTDMAIAKYEDVDYLVIDEIDKTQGTPMEFPYLYSLINKRYNAMLSTVLITNARPEEFKEIIGVSTLDRVASEGKVIDLTGDNYRQKR